MLNVHIESLKKSRSAQQMYDEKEVAIMLLDYLVYLHDAKKDVGAELRKDYILLFKELAKIPTFFMSQNILLYLPGAMICEEDMAYQYFLMGKIISYRVLISQRQEVLPNTDTLLEFNNFIDSYLIRGDVATREFYLKTKLNIYVFLYAIQEPNSNNTKLLFSLPRITRQTRDYIKKTSSYVDKCGAKNKPSAYLRRLVMNAD